MWARDDYYSEFSKTIYEDYFQANNQIKNNNKEEEIKKVLEDKWENITQNEHQEINEQ